MQSPQRDEVGEDALPAKPAGFWISRPPPEKLSAGAGNAIPPKRQAEVFHAGFWLTLGRLRRWMAVALRHALGSAVDKLRGRDTLERRASRLRALLEEGGATFIKLGQQLSIRIDLLPYEYALELEKMLDDVPAFPACEAVAAIERCCRRPLEEVFAHFDPHPIGSASIACVYRAVLHGGQPVAVKVRRPGIGPLFAADLRALAWLMRPVEVLFYPWGFFRHLLFELETMLMEELDFRKEARYTDLFRRRVRKDKLRFVSAPRVFFGLSNHEVLVMKLVSGIPLTEVIRAAETKDDEALAVLEQQGIRPKRLARRVLRVSRYGAMEAPFFHADLHPANIFVHADSRITLIDFGSCGSITERERHLWRRIVYAQARGDVGGMVQAVLGTMEPLPYIDVDELARRIEMVFWQDLFASRSKDAQWWERTTANLWIAFFSITGEYKMPMHLNTLRMVRVTLLADSLAARLHSRIRPFDEYRRFDTAAGRRARKRLRKKLLGLGSEAAFVGYEELYEAGMTAFHRLQRALDQPRHRRVQQEKTAHFITALCLRSLFQMAGVTAAALAGAALWQYATGAGSASLAGMLRSRLGTLEGWATLLSQPWYLGFLGAWAALVTRQIFLRLRQKR